MGGSKTTTNSTQELKLPEWVSQGGQQTFQNASNWMANNPTKAYTGEMAAAPGANQQAAMGMAAQTANAGADTLAAAKAGTMAAGQGGYQPVFSQSWNDRSASRYMSPFAENVRDNTLRVMDRNNATQLQSVGDAAAAAKSFGGMRHGVVEGAMRRDQAQARNDYVDQANEAAYNDAYNKFSGDRAASTDTQKFNSTMREQALQRALAASGQMGNLSAQEGDMASRGIGQLLLTGGVDQDYRQALADAGYNEFLRQQSEPLDRYSQLAGILSGVPYNKTTTGTETTKKSGGLFSSILGGLSVAGSIFSDRRLKRDIVKLGELAKGVGVYAYNYLWPSTRQIGVMADEVRRVVPEAVQRDERGYDRVDYAKLTEALA